MMLRKQRTRVRVRPIMAKSKMGRPPKVNKAPLPPVTGVRIPEDILARLDAMVDAENARLAPTGASISRSALIVRILREATAQMPARGEAP